MMVDCKIPGLFVPGFVLNAAEGMMYFQKAALRPYNL
jgi:hypothetical protein